MDILEGIRIVRGASRNPHVTLVPELGEAVDGLAIDFVPKIKRARCRGRQHCPTPAPDLFEGLTWGMYEAGKRVMASDCLLAKAALQQAKNTRVLSR